MQALATFGTIPAAGSGRAAAASALRGTVVQLGMLQSNAQAGNLSLLADPGATWVTPGGRLVEVDKCRKEPADAAAAGITWVDGITVRPVTASDGGGVWEEGSEQAGQLLLVTYQLWSFRGQGRDDGHVRMCSALVRVEVAGDVGGYKLVHLHESLVMDGAAITKGLVALVESTKPSFVPELKQVLAAGGGANGQ